jgi:ribose/xylose/arabinose/galactoside ABC-type transport system permease subunit
VQEILAKLLGTELLGGTIEVLGELADAGPVRLLGAGLEGQQAEVIGEAIQDCVRGGLFLCMVVSNDSWFYDVYGAATRPAGRRPEIRSGRDNEIYE